MPRKRRASFKRDIAPDLKYGDALVSQLINMMIWEGKKAIVQKVAYQAFDLVKEKTKAEPLAVFRKALENIKPSVEVRSRRVGGATYQVPVEVRSDRRISLGLKWLVGAARTRKGKSMANNLAAEILEAAENKGSAVKKREDTHKMAEANRAFAHYRW